MLAPLQGAQQLMEVFCLRKPLRALVGFLWLHASHSSDSSIQALRTWRTRTNHFVGMNFVQFACFLSSRTQRMWSSYRRPQLIKRRWRADSCILDSRNFYWIHQCYSSRQTGRVRKLRLLCQGQFTNTKMMVHYFHCTRQGVSKLVSSVYSTPGKRLWLRVRRRLRTLGILRLHSTAPVQPTECWSLLVALSQSGKQAFHMEAYLRSAQVSTLFMVSFECVIVNASARPPRLAGLPTVGTCNYRYTRI